MTKDNQPMPELLPCPTIEELESLCRDWVLEERGNMVTHGVVDNARIAILAANHLLSIKRATPTDASGFDFQGALDAYEKLLKPTIHCFNLNGSELSADGETKFIKLSDVQAFADHGEAIRAALSTMAKAKKEGK